MTTERLYWADSYLREWTAEVVERRAPDQIALDRSAFYPEGGGQPADRGTIEGIPVIDVQSDGEDRVWHTLARPLEAARVRCALDWQRRFDHMQQHHGQHLLSAACEHLYEARTLAFHLGATNVTIDLDARSLDAEQIAAIEDLTNEVIWADEPINARFVTPEELATIALRKPPTVTGAIRVVSAGDFDHSACGGTHPRSTGGVGMLHIRRVERRGEGLRVEFACGGRALRDLRAKNAALGRIAQGFSVSHDGVEAAIARLREDAETARKSLREATKELTAATARDLVAGAPRYPLAGGGDLAVVRRIWQDRGPDEVRSLAQAVAAAGGLALFGLRGAKAQLFFAGDGAIDCGGLLREAAGACGGKGGGTAQGAQGGVPNPDDLERALDRAAERVAELARLA